MTALELVRPPALPAMPEPLLTAEQVAGILSVRPKRVYELGIPAVRLSKRALRWQLSDVREWIAKHRTAA